MIVINEVKKIFGKNTLLIMLSLLVLNGVLILAGEIKRDYNFSGEDYRKLYSSEGMQGKAEEQLEHLKACIEENGITRQYFLLRYVISDIEKTLGYQEYLNNIAESALKYGRLSIFANEDGFSKRNIKKTADVYGSLPEIEIVPGKSRGVVMASQYNGSVILGFVFVMYIVFMIVTREKEIGSLNLTMTTKHGAARHGAVKLMMCLISSVVIAILFETENWAISACYYGLGDMGRSIQSIPEYQPCIFDISIAQFMLLSVCFRTMCIFMVSAVVFLVACRSRGLIGLTIKLAVVFGIEGLAYYAVTGNSVWGLVKYINIYGSLASSEILGNYLNLNLFGYPVWYLPVFIIFSLVVITVSAVWGVYAYADMGALPSERKLKLIRLPSATSSLFLQECYRYLICEHVLWIIILLILIRVLTFSPVRETFAFQDDVYYKQYMLKLEGEYSEEKEVMIDEEEQTYREITEKANAASASTDDVSIRNLIWMKYNDETAHFKVLDKVKEQARYLKDKQGAFMYDQGYRILAGEDSGEKQNRILGFITGLMMVICSVFIYAPDYQTGTYRMIRAARNGRMYLFARREIIGTVILLIIYGIIFVPYILSVLNAYGTQGIDFPACSIQCLEWCPRRITIRLYLIGQNIIRFIIYWLSMNFIMYISSKAKSMSYTLVVGILLCLIGIMI